MHIVLYGLGVNISFEHCIDFSINIDAHFVALCGDIASLQGFN